MDNTLYEMVFKRRSFHLFRNVGNESIGEADEEFVLNAKYTID